MAHGHRRTGACRAVESLSAGIEAGAMAGIVFYSAGCFAAILSTRGHDVRLLMQGVAGGTGLVNLFRRLTKVQTAVRAPPCCVVLVPDNSPARRSCSVATGAGAFEHAVPAHHALLCCVASFQGAVWSVQRSYCTEVADQACCVRLRTDSEHGYQVV